MKDSDVTRRIMQARLIAAELWELMRKDAVHRLGLAQAYPNAIDKDWSPEFYRKCQLAERLFGILDDILACDQPPVAGSKGRKPTRESAQGSQAVVAHPSRVSGRRFRV